jgi:hypothetical protein
MGLARPLARLLREHNRGLIDLDKPLLKACGCKCSCARRKRIGDDDLCTRADVVLMDGAHYVGVRDVRDRAPGFAIHRHTARLNLGSHTAVKDDQRPGRKSPMNVLTRTQGRSIAKFAMLRNITPSGLRSSTRFDADHWLGKRSPWKSTHALYALTAQVSRRSRPGAARPSAPSR